MAINPDPNYVNQEIENLSLETPGSIEALDQFNAPPPGHSLTGEPGAWPWEKPPVYTDPDEALEFVEDKIDDPANQEEFLKLMLAGIPVEAITNTITFTGFQEGFWTPDIAELIKLPISMELAGLALEKNIPATMFNIPPKEQQEADEIPEGEVYKAMQENRPDMYDDLSYVMDVMSEQYEEEGSEEEVIEDEPSFMNMEETV